MNLTLRLRLLTLTISSFALMMAFQNCGAKFDFSSSVAGAALVTTANPTGDGNPAELPPATPESGDPTMGAGGPSKPPKGPASGGKPEGECNSPGTEESIAANLVECELGSSKNKIILSTSLVVGSNAQVTRLCMSENACLKLVNAYAEARNCSISTGAPMNSAMNSAAGSCTAIFPGSKGTCKNANVISDDQIVKILSAMSGGA